MAAGRRWTNPTLLRHSTRLLSRATGARAHRGG